MRFMTTSLAKLVDNLTKGIHKIKCKYCDCFFEYQSVQDDWIKYKCFSYNKDYSNKLDGELNKKFKNTFKFSNNDIKKIILLLRKGVYPNEYMDDWERFNGTKLPEKEEFYSNLKVKKLQMHIACLQKDFEVKIQVRKKTLK